MKIVFLGNFKFPFSTESHHAWTWERLGHTVIRLQENSATTDQVLAACEGAQLFSTPTRIRGTRPVLFLWMKCYVAYEKRVSNLSVTTSTFIGV